jgi:hypothetical protein
MNTIDLCYIITHFLLPPLLLLFDPPCDETLVCELTNVSTLG